MRQEFYHKAYVLGLFTVGYNLIEGSVATLLGSSDETLALFGFGVDSFVEVLSGIGVVHMIVRSGKAEVDQADSFEVTALKITGIAFYVLVAGLGIGAFLSIWYKAEPETTLAGVVISLISILIMYFLYRAKIKVGQQLNNQALISDANCTKTCFYLSFILLVSSLLYEFLKVPYIDALGSLGIVWYAWKEGREAFEKARGKKLACTDDCC